MAFSKTHRILILLAIDSAFFFLELIIGYAVHSLALVADSFHMLNDVLSLCVGLWAVKVANQRTNSKMYTYGWQRAETLGALVNGVFLVALCLSIFLEAIQRFVEPQEVSHPKLVMIVGCFGLASNIIGLFLFHDHGHSHGGHSHGRSDAMNAAEEGHAGHSHADDEDHAVADESGSIVDVLPESRVGNLPSTITNTRRKASDPRSRNVSWSHSNASTVRANSTVKRNRKQHSRSRSRGYSSIEEIYVHPSSFRSEIINASRIDEGNSSTDDNDTDGAGVVDGDDTPTEASPLLRSDIKRSHSSQSHGKHDLHAEHKHNAHKSGGSSGHGHSHGDLNMRGVFLHVMGDALGNIGVITSALFIWLTDFWWRFYADPLISLIITVIILCSAIPLCKAASRILLQAVPAGISIDDIKDDISELKGIVSCHHLHVWQLSDTKLVASLHVQVGFDFKGEGSARYMTLARQVRKCLHEYGIHSSTIQPEFCLDKNHDHVDPAEVAADTESSCDEEYAGEGGSHGNGNVNGNGTASNGKDSMTGGTTGEDVCLLECGDDCEGGKQCCPQDGTAR